MHRWLVITEQRCVDLTRHVPLQTPDDVVLQEALLGASDNVGDGGLMPLHADNDDPIQGGIGLAGARLETADVDSSRRLMPEWDTRHRV
jgi:hypothetical protein